MFIVPQRTLPAVAVSLLLALLSAVAGGMQGSPTPHPAPGVARADSGRASVAQATGPASPGRPIAAGRHTPSPPLGAPLPPPG